MLCEFVVRWPQGRLTDALLRVCADTRVRSGKWALEQAGGEEEEGKGEGERGSGEEVAVRHKRPGDRQRESAKLLDLESPVDARRSVQTFISRASHGQLISTSNLSEMGVGDLRGHK